MRKKIALASVAVALATSCIILFAMQTDNPSKQLYQRLGKITGDYGETAYLSVFSLDELRPFSIIQFSKTSEIYDNKWIAPEKLVLLLDEGDKKKLIETISEYLSEMPQEESKRILTKLEHRCIAAEQLGFLQKRMGILPDDILKALYFNKTTSIAFTRIFQQGWSENIKDVSEADKNQAYHLALNKIAELNMVSQLDYYSGFFKQLTLIARID